MDRTLMLLLIVLFAGIAYGQLRKQPIMIVNIVAKHKTERIVSGTGQLFCTNKSFVRPCTRL